MSADESVTQATANDETRRPLRADARRNRTRVLEAARDAFAEQGLAVPLDEIARRAGVGAGTVYRHFPSKEALFEAVLVSRTQRIADEARVLARSEDPGAAFFDFFDRMIDEGGAKKDLVEALTGAGFDVSDLMSGVLGEMSKALGELLEAAQRAGALRRDVNVTDLMALMAGAVTSRHGNVADEPGSRVLAVIRDGLRPR